MTKKLITLSTYSHVQIDPESMPFDAIEEEYGVDFSDGFKTTICQLADTLYGSLYEYATEPDKSKIMPAVIKLKKHLQPINELLNDEQLIDVLDAAALERCSTPSSRLFHNGNGDNLYADNLRNMIFNWVDVVNFIETGEHYSGGGRTQFIQKFFEKCIELFETHGFKASSYYSQDHKNKPSLLISLSTLILDRVKKDLQRETGQPREHHYLRKERYKDHIVKALKSRNEKTEKR